MKAGALFCSICGSSVAEEAGTPRPALAKGGKSPSQRSRKKAGKKGKQGWGQRIFLVLIGLLLFAYGSVQVLLIVAGQTRTATVTGVTQERDDEGDRYYMVKYQFTVDGSRHSGSYRVSDTSKYPSTGGTVRVRYLPGYPSMNDRDDGASLSISGLIFLGLGGFFLVLAAKR